MKTNAILLLIVLIVAGIFYWDQTRQEAAEKQEQEEKQLTVLEPSDVQSITIKNHYHDRIRAERQGNQWRIVEPYVATGDQTAWEAIATSLAGGERQRVIEENPKDLERFGLQQPAAEVTLAGTETANATSSIAFGNETPTSGKYYALIKDSSEVVTLFSNAFSNVDKRLFDLRDKTVLNVPAAQVQRVQISSPSMELVVERSEDNHWEIRQPFQAKADDTLLMDLIAQVNNSRVKQFIEEKPDFYEAYDLVEPATKLVFWVGEPGDASATAARALLFGSTNESQYVYAKREGQDNVFAVSPSDFNKIPKNPEELRLKRVTAMRSWEVNQITVASATDTIFEASKEASEWQLLKPQEGKPDYTAISELIRTIVELEAESFVSGTLEDYQLNAPALTITLTAEKGAAAIPLQPGAAIGRDPNYYYAARQNPTEIMALPAEAVESMLTDLETLQLQSEPPAEETPALEEVPAAEPE